jgi:purine-binding chemotaxis protein CheW
MEVCTMSELQTVVFDLNGQLFGAEASQVFQIIRYQEATKVPRMPRFIEGIINYRGSVLPVINLARRFDIGEIEVTKKTKILVTKLDEKFAGFIVNDVSEIIKFTDEDIEPAPLIINSEAGAYLKKVGKKDGKLISIIDLENVLNKNEIKRLSIKEPKA